MTESGKTCGVVIDGGSPDNTADNNEESGSRGSISKDSLKFCGAVEKSPESNASAKKPPKSLCFRALLYNKQAVPTAFVTPHTVSMSVQPRTTPHQRPTDHGAGSARMRASTPRSILSARFGDETILVDDRYDGAAVGQLAGGRRPLSSAFDLVAPARDISRTAAPARFTAGRPIPMKFEAAETVSPLDDQFYDGARLRSPQSLGFGVGAAAAPFKNDKTTLLARFDERRPFSTRLGVETAVSELDHDHKYDEEAYPTRISAPRPLSATFGPETDFTAFQPPRRASLVGAATKMRGESVLPRVCPDMPQRRAPSQLETFHSTYASPRPSLHAPSSFLANGWADGVAVAGQKIDNLQCAYAADQSGYDSDDRLHELERRMRELERRLADQQQQAAASSRDGAVVVAHGLQSSKSLRDLDRAASPSAANGAAMSALWTTLPPSLACSTNGVFYPHAARPQTNDVAERDERLSMQIKNLQNRLEEERQIRQNLVKQNSKEFLWKADENETLKCRIKELEAENQLWKVKSRLFGGPEEGPQAASKHQPHGFQTRQQPTMKSSLSMDNLIKEKQYLEHTVENLQSQLERVQSASTSLQAEPAPDQYVPMQRYRLLKAKSKKLLSAKCDALRTENLAKESLQVQMQLQNKELSELRQKVYQPEQLGNEYCECGVSLENLSKQREDLLQTIKACSFATSCLLGVCKDIANHKSPDHDQILGIKAENGMTTSSFLRNSENKSAQDLNTQQFYDHVIDSVKKSQKSLSDMQHFMTECYADQLADSIDCRLQ